MGAPVAGNADDAPTKEKWRLSGGTHTTTNQVESRRAYGPNPVRLVGRADARLPGEVCGRTSERRGPIKRQEVDESAYLAGDVAWSGDDRDDVGSRCSSASRPLRRRRNWERRPGIETRCFPPLPGGRWVSSGSLRRQRREHSRLGTLHTSAAPAFDDANDESRAFLALDKARLRETAVFTTGFRGLLSRSTETQNPRMDADLFHRAVIAFLEYGRGAVVILTDDPEPLYVRADVTLQQLSEWKAEPAFIDAVGRATASYDSEREAVVVREEDIRFTVSIERREGGEAGGAVSWSAVN